MPLMERFHPAVSAWFARAFPEATPAQRLGWPVVARGESALILAPTGSGKTLAAFLWCLDRLMFEPPPEAAARCRVVYVSPLKALAVDIERNLRAPLVGIAGVARDRGDPCHVPAVAVRTPEAEPERTTVARSVATALADLARTGEGRQGGLLVAEINGGPAAAHPLAPFLEEAGSVASALGFQVRREPRWCPADAAAPARRATGASRGLGRPG